MPENLADNRTLPGSEDCAVVIHTVLGGRKRAGLYTDEGVFRLDRREEPPFETIASVVEAAEAPVIRECVPFDIVERRALDRDEDGVWNGDETDANTVPR